MPPDSKLSLCWSANCESAAFQRRTVTSSNDGIIELSKHVGTNHWYLSPAVRKSKNVLLHKKIDKRDLKNYRPFCLLLHQADHKNCYKSSYKASWWAAASEQTGFQRNYNTADNVFNLKQLLKRAREYRSPFCLYLVDYAKAFDSTELNVLLRALGKEKIDGNYVEIVKEANTGCSTDVALVANRAWVAIEKGVR